ncbi:hypothetical protein MUP51_07455 [Candidatus Bathyarchaeota archaeon]|nr:hypothetical protein [Candidatus Bathyarchaeota archaeon]TFH13429.1 MAG: hypothetical protein E4H04_11960 [Candidatus Bathyarchaeota archaeon]
MNKLVEYLAEHYHPSGNAFKIVLVPELIEKSGFTVEEVHLMAIESYKEEIFLIGRIQAQRWLLYGSSLGPPSSKLCMYAPLGV